MIKLKNIFFNVKYKIKPRKYFDLSYFILLSKMNNKEKTKQISLFIFLNNIVANTALAIKNYIHLNSYFFQFY